MIESTTRKMVIECCGGRTEVDIDIAYYYNSPYPERTTEPYEPASDGAVKFYSIKLLGVELDHSILTDEHFRAIEAEILAEKLEELT